MPEQNSVYSQMGSCGEPWNLDDFAAVSAKFCKLAHGIWQKILQKTVGLIN